MGLSRRAFLGGDGWPLRWAFPSGDGMLLFLGVRGVVEDVRVESRDRGADEDVRVESRDRDVVDLVLDAGGSIGNGSSGVSRSLSCLRLSEDLVLANCKTLGPEDFVTGGSRFLRLTVVFAADGTAT